MKTPKDLTKESPFGRLTVIKLLDKKDYKLIGKRYRPTWLCQCICGNVVKLTSGQLISGNTKSCGCLFKDIGIAKCKNKIIRLKMVKSIKTPKSANSLAEKCPESLQLWDYEKNYPKTPNSVKYQSHDKVWFKCLEYGHNYYITVNAFYQGGNRCKYCSNKEILIGFNDLATTHSYLLKEWDYIKNKILPTQITAKSNKKIYWLCQDCKNSWITTPHSRVSQLSGCCQCESSNGEKQIYNILNKYNINYTQEFRFNNCRYKKPLPFDFYLSDLNILIEYQGSQHYIGWSNNKKSLQQIQQRDSIKQQYCKDNNIKLIIIPYTEFNNIEQILIQELNIKES